MNYSPPESDHTLRQRAEKKIGMVKGIPSEPLSSAEANRLLHELQVQQVELEMQNLELRESRQELESAHHLSRAELCTCVEQYQALLATELFGFFLIDTCGNLLEVNDTYCRMSGYSREELLQRSVADIDADESAEETARHLQQLMQSGIAHFETRHRAKDGRIFHVEVSTTWLKSQKQSVVLLRDITDRKQAEHALKESEARYHAIVEDQTDLICRYRPDGKITFVNDSYLRCFNKKRTELINRNYIPHIPEPDLSQVLRRLEKIRRDRPQTAVEHRVIMPDGLVQWQYWIHRGIYSPDGNLMEYQAVGRDITKRKKFEAELQESRQQYRNLVEGTSDLIASVDPEGRLVFVNHAAVGFWGLTPEACIGRCAFDFIHPEDREQTVADVHAWLASEKESFVCENRQVGVDGRVLAVSWVVNAKYDENGVVCGFSGSARDITGRKQVEEALQQAKSAADAANQAKSAFLSTMSHEIRTPLSALLGNIGLLDSSQLPLQQQKYLKGCQSAAQILLQVINDVLDFSKIEAGKLELSNETFSLSSMTQELVKLFAPNAELQGISLILELAENLPACICADQHRLRQIIANLITNAIKFTDAGTVTLKITREEPASSLDSDRIGLVISVSDTGRGIPLDKQAIIFESFTQLEPFTTRRHTGTGLGLVICRRLTEMMGGTISLSSLPGKGSVFTLSLPVTVCQPPQLQTARQTKQQTVTPRNILLADDDELCRDVITELLQRRGHCVTPVESGASLLDTLQRQKFDIILSDISMPDMDGIEVTRIIRSGERTGISPHIPIIAMTAHAFAQDERLFLASGINGYASKPVNLEKLLRQIEQLCCPPIGGAL